MSVTGTHTRFSTLNHTQIGQITLAVAAAGLFGEVLFELYAWLVSPVLFGASLQPAKLVIAIISKLTGITLGYNVAFVVHFLVGALGFGAFVFLFRLLLPGRVLLAGVLSGLVLWFVAQGFLAPFIGRSFMMGFGAYTQSSFVGHVGMTVVMSFLMQTLIARFTTPKQEPTV